MNPMENDMAKIDPEQNVLGLLARHPPDGSATLSEIAPHFFPHQSANETREILTSLAGKGLVKMKFEKGLRRNLPENQKIFYQITWKGFAKVISGLEETLGNIVGTLLKKRSTPTTPEHGHPAHLPLHDVSDDQPPRWCLVPVRDEAHPCIVCHHGTCYRIDAPIDARTLECERQLNEAPCCQNCFSEMERTVAKEMKRIRSIRKG